jgi:glucosamine 6-phosphate synthetase-like amidotransferase/phosphosugar isomerase protein
MCCLFGVLNYGDNLSHKHKNAMLSVLATESEERGVDATGIAYNTLGRLAVYKRPQPAHQLVFNVPNNARYIMGHTRMTTQGSERWNYNNHPFTGVCRRAGRFALSHNGVLYNDIWLRDTEKIPKTKIQTDSYIAVQLIEQQSFIDFNSLKRMAEKVMGSFTFTVLTQNNDLYIVKGDNPMCLIKFPRQGLYMYASTEKILLSALRKLRIRQWEFEAVPLSCGDILRIDKKGSMSRGSFNFNEDYYFMRRASYSSRPLELSDNGENEYLETLKMLAPSFGYTPIFVEKLYHDGFACEEIEDILYEPSCGDGRDSSENERYRDII